MQVRKFQSNSIEEAKYLVRKAFGADALILSTKKIKNNKYGDAGKKFEIWAVPNDIYDEKETYKDAKEHTIEKLEKDLNRIKNLLMILAKENGEKEKHVGNAEIFNIYTKLLKAGMSKKYVNEILKNGGVFEKENVLKSKELHRKIFSEIFKKIKVKEIFVPKTEKKQIIALVGPTGVGKTTTVGKLAAKIQLEQKRKVGLITIDNYRIGATDQLKSYAKILGVPCFPAFDIRDLKFAIKRLCEKDVILIDTAGHSQYDETRMNELRNLFNKEKSIECHLLISTTTNENEMQTVTKNFGKLKTKSYIFTKTDEVRNKGIIINQLIRSNLPVSYFTTGQRVPEDIVKATKAGVIGLMFQ